jgi:hypothetical protein
MSVRPEDANLLTVAKWVAGEAARRGPRKPRVISAAIEGLERSPDSEQAHAEAVAGVSAAMASFISELESSIPTGPWPRIRKISQTTTSVLSNAFPLLVSAVLVFYLSYFTYIYKTSVLLRDDLVGIQKADFVSKAERLYTDWTRLKYSSRAPISPTSANPSEYYSELADVIQAANHFSDDHDQVGQIAEKAWFRGFRQFMRDKLGGKDQSQIVINIDRDHDPSYRNNDHVIDEDSDFITFVRFLELTKEQSVPIGSFNEWLSRDISSLEDIITIYGLWVLPALYALFGMMVFYFRSLVNPALKKPGHPVGRAVLAVMAGVSVSWLFNSLNATTFGGLTVFVLAFLFGFSLNAFFATLDRLVSSLSKLASAST